MARAITLFFVLVLIGLFALINWPAFTALTTLSLVFTTVQAPLGLIMLGLALFLSLLFTMWAISLQASNLLEARRYAKELQAQRELADTAEASRFVELRSYLTGELQRVSDIATNGHGTLLSRMEHMEGALRLTLEQTANSVAATVGEFEDRIERGSLPPPEITQRNDGTPPIRR
ncbi:MAG: LapA family protein [Rhizobacter sp.]